MVSSMLKTMRTKLIKWSWALFGAVAKKMSNSSSTHAGKDLNHIIWQEVCSNMSFPQGATILDAGCGGGHLVQCLAESGCHAVGVDFVPRFIGNTHGDFVLADVRNLPFRDKTFDAIVCYSVMQYLGGAEVAQLVLHELARLVKDSGQVLLGEVIQCRGYFNRHILSSDLSWVRKLLLLAYLNSPLYQYYFINTASWVGMFQAAGFTCQVADESPEMPYHANMKHYILTKAMGQGRASVDA